MRDFLFSDVAAIHGFSNIPDYPDRAVAAGTQLCTQLLEPLQDAFGRVAIRSAYRSGDVNAFGNQHGHNCASNEANAAGHIWDMLDRDGCMGATACVVVPGFWNRFQADGDWRKLAWWIHDHLPHSGLEFFKPYWAFNISWHERPVRSITSWMAPRVLTKPGMANNEGDHEFEWAGIV